MLNFYSIIRVEMQTESCSKGKTRSNSQHAEKISKVISTNIGYDKLKFHGDNIKVERQQSRIGCRAKERWKRVAIVIVERLSRTRTISQVVARESVSQCCYKASRLCSTLELSLPPQGSHERDIRSHF